MTIQQEERLSPEFLDIAKPVQSTLQTTFQGRSHTEIARAIAKDHGWMFLGDSLVSGDGLVIADTIEKAAEVMLSLGWFDPSGAYINWHTFGPTKPSNAATLHVAVGDYDPNCECGHPASEHGGMFEAYPCHYDVGPNPCSCGAGQG